MEIINVTRRLPKSLAAQVLGRQMLRSGTSVGANYRAVCRAKARADFISKMSNVEEECDETLFWLELLVDADNLNLEYASPLLREGEEILSMVVASINTARSGS